VTECLFSSFSRFSRFDVGLVGADALNRRLSRWWELAGGGASDSSISEWQKVAWGARCIGLILLNFI